MTTAFTVVIPSRYASTRLPGKPLQLIGSKPMIQLVWEQACKSSAERVVVATDDPRIIEACQGFGAEAVLTRRCRRAWVPRLCRRQQAQIIPPNDEQIYTSVHIRLKTDAYSDDFISDFQMNQAMKLHFGIQSWQRKLLVL